MFNAMLWGGGEEFPQMVVIVREVFPKIPLNSGLGIIVSCPDTVQLDCLNHQIAMASLYGRFLKWWYPQNTPKWSFLVGKPMVVGYHHFRKPPYVFMVIVAFAMLGMLSAFYFSLFHLPTFWQDGGLCVGLKPPCNTFVTAHLKLISQQNASHIEISHVTFKPFFFRGGGVGLSFFCWIFPGSSLQTPSQEAPQLRSYAWTAKFYPANRYRWWFFPCTDAWRVFFFKF